MSAEGRREPLYDLPPAPIADGGPVRLALLGATGSIGRQTVDLVLRDPERFRVTAVTTHVRTAELSGLVAELESAGVADAPLAAVSDDAARAEAARDPRLGRNLAAPGAEGLCEAAAADGVDCVVNGLVGAAGLAPTLAAARRGRRIALANKESLVVGGDLVREAVRAHGATVSPVDSEHSALAQCLSGRDAGEIEALILTASGGPCRTWDAARIASATRSEVLAHPTWEMGPKITVDSASLMNKGLEVIEAHVLYGVPYADIRVVVHPRSIVHSCVQFRDGAMIAQLGAPDMKVPLLYAVRGERHESLDGGRVDLAELGRLEFERPDVERFPCLRLAREAGEAGGRLPIALNAANEEAVAAFLDDRVGFGTIPDVIARTIEETPPAAVPDLETALGFDREARGIARGFLES